MNELCTKPFDNLLRFHNNWPNKSTTSYAILDFESEIENL